MDFHLLQASFPVPTQRTHSMQQTNWDHDHGQRVYAIVPAVLLIAPLCGNSGRRIMIM